MEKNWKLYDDKLNNFTYKTFEDNKNLESYWGFDFIYREIYNWEESVTGCIYEGGIVTGKQIGRAHV